MSTHEDDSAIDNQELAEGHNQSSDVSEPQPQQQQQPFDELQITDADANLDQQRLDSETAAAVAETNDTEQQDDENPDKEPCENNDNEQDDINNDDQEKADNEEEDNEDEEEEDDDDDEEDQVKVTIEDTVPDYNLLAKQRQPQQAKQAAIDIDAGQAILDVDLSTLEDKPWRKPGADISDYFNYGFDEDTWKLYCEKQKKMKAVVGELNHSTSEINAHKIPVMAANDGFSFPDGMVDGRDGVGGGGRGGGVMKIPTIVSHEPRFNTWMPPVNAIPPDAQPNEQQTSSHQDARMNIKDDRDRGRRKREREGDRHSDRHSDSRHGDRHGDRHSDRHSERDGDRHADRDSERHADRDREKTRDRKDKERDREKTRSKDRSRDKDKPRERESKKREREKSSERDRKRKRSSHH